MGKDDKYIGKAGNFLLMKGHKRDEILTEHEGRKFERQKKRVIAGKCFKTTDSEKLMHKELNIRIKLS